MKKVEIDITKESQVNAACQLASKYRCPAVVVSPELVVNTTIARAMARASFKIITAVDWPKGNQYLVDKFRGMPTESLRTDGFEILLTPKDNFNAITKEVIFLSSFIRDHFNPTIEVRFILGYHMPDRTDKLFEWMLQATKRIPSPTFLRTTYLTKIPSSDGTTESQQALLQKIYATRRLPIKLSGNITHRIRTSCDVARYGCSYEQARQLCDDLSDPALKNIKKDIEQATVQT